MNSMWAKEGGTSKATDSLRFHIMSVDVEDYFMVEAFSRSVSRESWDSWPSRVAINTSRVLELFDTYNVKATFFFVGWVAKKFPELVREVSARGHELACHSYWHRTVYSLTPVEFREDTRTAVKAIEDAAGVKVRGYRAPSWSITKECLWALEILAEEGFAYDSSIYPIHHDLYGVPGAKRFPYTHHLKSGRHLLEFPPTTVRLLGQNLPGAGGGYLRIFPLAYTHWVFRKFQEDYGERVVVYFHPWELDPEQPRIQEKLKSKFRHYTHLGQMGERLQTLLLKYRFQAFSNLCPKVTQLESNEGLSFTGLPPTRVSPVKLSVEASPETEGAGGADKASLSISTGGIRPQSNQGRRIKALTYHTISQKFSSSPYTVSCRQLEEQLSFLARFSKGNDGANKDILVTFDDGYLSNFEDALPILQKYSIRAIFFVVAGFIDSRRDFMTWPQLRELVALGHKVQSHTWSHPLLTECSGEDLRSELERSRLVIEQNTGKSVEALGVPGGRWNSRVLNAARDAGYRQVYISDPWIASQRWEGIGLSGRLTIKSEMQLSQLQSLINGRGAYCRLFSVQYRAKEILRRAVGDSLYRRIWTHLVNDRSNGEANW